MRTHQKGEAGKEEGGKGEDGTKGDTSQMVKVAAHGQGDNVAKRAFPRKRKPQEGVPTNRLGWVPATFGPLGIG